MEISRMYPARKLFAVASTAMMLLTVTACRTETGPGSAEAKAPMAEAAICNRDAAEALVGKDRMTDDQARQLTGATKVRQIAPDAMVTMEFLQERVTIETDPNSGKIVRAYCG